MIEYIDDEELTREWIRMKTDRWRRETEIEMERARKLEEYKKALKEGRASCGVIHHE